jgi:hypothetical protein
MEMFVVIPPLWLLDKAPAASHQVMPICTGGKPQI